MKLDFIQNIIRYKEISSTNDIASKLVSKFGFHDFTVIITDFQTKGKGQRDKYWESERGKNLLISVILKPNLNIKDSFVLNICMSLSIIDLLSSLSINNLKIKWPNDVLVDCKKISGVLIQNQVQQSSIKSSIIGVGINVNQKKFKLYNPEATSIYIETSKEFQIEDIKDSLLSSFKKRYKKILNGKLKGQKKEYLKHLYLYKERVNFNLHGKRLSGIIKDVDYLGRLVVDIEGEDQTAFSSDSIHIIY